MQEGSLAGLHVINLGGRPAVGFCADLLARGGASVEHAAINALPAEGGDVLLYSSDVLGESEYRIVLEYARGGSAILCDLATEADSAGRRRRVLTEGELQAISGLMDVTGFPSGGATFTPVPVVEISAALYAASAIAAVRLSQERREHTKITVSLLECAIAMLTTFLPRAFIGERPTRVGNRHPACAPWNAYLARDGWVLICTATDEQWYRLRDQIDLAQLRDPRFDRLSDRVAAAATLDEAMAEWASGIEVAACLAVCEAAGVPAGPIVAPVDLGKEANFRFRHPLAALAQEGGATAGEVAAGVTLFRTEPLVEDSKQPAAAAPWPKPSDATLPLAGVAVVEIGQFTAVPLATKHLAILGADVVKVEPPGGEVSRRWQPSREGMSYYFAMTNSGKRLQPLDFSRREDRNRLAELITSADILIENMRPGGLEKLGFDREKLSELNPTLVYCSVSGFGHDSAYPGRPAFDTVVQAMSGMMHLTCSDGRPVKLGISAADILGAQTALLALLTTLPARGCFVDLAMHDITAWSSIVAEASAVGRGQVVPCLDGALWIEDAEAITGSDSRNLALSTTLPRAAAISHLRECGIRSVAVAKVEEIMHDPAFTWDALATARDPDGRLWPALKPPYRIAGTEFPSAPIPGVAGGNATRY